MAESHGAGSRGVGWMLIGLGLAVVMVHLYVLGVAEGKSSGAMPEEARRIATIKRTSVTGMGGGVLIVGVGTVLVRRGARPRRPDG